MKPLLVHSSVDVLCAVPVMLGFEPERSLVLVPVTRSQGLAVLRFDLPGAEDSAETRGTLLEHAAGLIALMPEVLHVHAFVFTDERVGAGALELRRRPHQPLIAAFERDHLTPLSITLRDALFVTPDAWGSLLTDDAATLEGDVRARHTLDLDAPSVIEPLLDHRAIEPASPAERRAMSGVMRTLATASADELFSTVVTALHRTQGIPSTREVAACMLGMQRGDLRDALLHGTAFGLLRDEGGQTVPFGTPHARWHDAESVSRWFMGHSTEVPDSAAMRRLGALLRRGIALTPVAMHCSAYAALAWMAWALGATTLATRHLEASRAIDASHGLTDLVDTCITLFGLPGWVGHQPI